MDSYVPGWKMGQNSIRHVANGMFLRTALLSSSSHAVPRTRIAVLWWRSARALSQKRRHPRHTYPASGKLTSPSGSPLTSILLVLLAIGRGHRPSATRHGRDSDTGWRDSYTGPVHVTGTLARLLHVTPTLAMQVAWCNQCCTAAWCRRVQFQGHCWFQIWLSRRLGQGNKCWNSCLLDPTKNEFWHSVCFSSLPWAYQLHQLHGQFILGKTSSDIVTRSLRTVSSRRIRTTKIWTRPKLSMRNSSNHIKFIKLRPRNGWTFFKLWFHMCYPKKTSRKPKFFTCPSWPLAAIVRGFNPGLIPLSFAEKDQGCVSQIFPYQWLAKECAKLIGLPPGKKSCTGTFILMNWKLVMWNWQAALLWCR